MNKNIFWIIPIVVMGIGFLPMPYGYYILSKLIVCGCWAEWIGAMAPECDSDVDAQGFTLRH